VTECLTALRNFVGGEYVDAPDGATSEVVDPVSGEAYARAPVSGSADVAVAFAAAATGRETWCEVTPSELSGE
jgi:betaine-aldehyde dehydrogenase